MREGDQFGQAFQILSWTLDQTQKEMSRNPKDRGELSCPATNGDCVCPWSAERRPTAASSFEIDSPRADSILRMENSVENNVSRQPELLDDEDPEQGDQGDQDIL